MKPLEAYILQLMKVIVATMPSGRCCKNPGPVVVWLEALYKSGTLLEMRWCILPILM